MSLKIEPKTELSKFEIQYLRDRGKNPDDYILDADEEEPDPDADADPDADDDEDEPYSEWKVEELETEIANRNAERGEDAQITAEGTGKNGAVLKDDLVRALEADDASDDETGA